MKIAILLLAAGASSRMRGRDKLLEEIDGEQLLRRVARRALSVQSVVFVALPKGSQTRQEALKGLAVNTLIVNDAAEGMSASIRAGVRAASEFDALMILPADMPELTERDLSVVLEGFKANSGLKIVRGASADGTPGHPVVFPKTYFEELSEIEGDTGGSSIVKKAGAICISLPDNHALTDLDTPEDWAFWQADR